MSQQGNTLIVWSASRSSGETAKTVDYLKEQLSEVDVVYLPDYELTPFDYEGANINDRHDEIVEKMLRADAIIFATPVYWYSMSGTMKVFFDRFSDLIRKKKESGRALAGKSVYLVANGNDDDLPEGFTVPFKRTAEYFDMNYKGHIYLSTKSDWSQSPDRVGAFNNYCRDIS